MKESLKDDILKGANEIQGMRDWPTKVFHDSTKPINDIDVNLPVNYS